MSADMLFFVLWLSSLAAIPAIVLSIVHFDRIALVFLHAINAPVYEEARRIAALIYQHPEQWTMSQFSLTHPVIGEICCVLGACSIHFEGKGFGRWESSRIERRIIYNAISWYRHDYIKHLVGRALTAAKGAGTVSWFETGRARWLIPPSLSVMDKPETERVGRPAGAKKPLGATRARPVCRTLHTMGTCHPPASMTQGLAADYAQIASRLRRGGGGRSGGWR